jgi:hypothetical protein
MYIEGTGFYTCKECHKTESLQNHTATAHKKREWLGGRRNVYDDDDDILSCQCEKMSILAVMSFCPQVKLIRNFGLRKPIKWSGIFSLQCVPVNAMVIRISWYSREGLGFRIAGQVGRFVPFVSFYRYTTAYDTC